MLILPRTLKNNLSLLSDPSVKVLKLITGQAGTEVIKDYAASLRAMTDKIADYKSGRDIVNARAVVKTNRPYVDMSSLMCPVPVGLSVTFMELSDAMLQVRNQLDDAGELVTVLTSYLERLLANVDGMTGLSPLTRGEIKTVDGILDSIQVIVAEALGDRSEKGELPYTDVVRRHADWNTVTTALVVLKSKAGDTSEILKQADRIESSTDRLLHAVKDIEKLSENRVREMSQMLYAIARVFEYEAMYTNIITQFEVCVKASLKRAERF